MLQENRLSTVWQNLREEVRGRVPVGDCRAKECVEGLGAQQGGISA